MKALITGGGVAGPVTAMALQRAGIEAVVYEAYVPDGDEAGSYLTVATNGLDALRAIDADKPVLAAGFPTPTNMLLSGNGRRLGTVSNGGRLADGTVSHTIKRPRLYRALHDEAAGRGIRIEYGRRLAGAEVTAGGAWWPPSRTAPGPPGTCWSAPTGSTRRPAGCSTRPRPRPRYVGLANFGGYTPGGAGAGEPGAWQMIFGRRAFFGYVDDPDGGTVWFANVPRPAVTPAERAATTPEQWQRQLVELFAGDHGPASRPDRRRLPGAGRRQHQRPAVGADLAPRPDGDHRRRRPRPVAHLGPGRLHGRRGRRRARPVPARRPRPSVTPWPPTRACAAGGSSASSPRAPGRAGPRPPARSAGSCAT